MYLIADIEKQLSYIKNAVNGVPQLDHVRFLQLHSGMRFRIKIDALRYLNGVNARRGFNAVTVGGGKFMETVVVRKVFRFCWPDPEGVAMYPLDATYPAHVALIGFTSPTRRVLNYFDPQDHEEAKYRLRHEILGRTSRELAPLLGVSEREAAVKRERVKSLLFADTYGISRKEIIIPSGNSRQMGGRSGRNYSYGLSADEQELAQFDYVQMERRIAAYMAQAFDGTTPVLTDHGPVALVSTDVSSEQVETLKELFAKLPTGDISVVSDFPSQQRHNRTKDAVANFRRMYHAGITFPTYVLGTFVTPDDLINKEES